MIECIVIIKLGLQYLLKISSITLLCGFTLFLAYVLNTQSVCKLLLKNRRDTRSQTVKNSSCCLSKRYGKQNFEATVKKSKCRKWEKN